VVVLWKDLAASRIAQGLEQGTADVEVQSATKKCILDRMKQVLTVASVSGSSSQAPPHTHTHHRTRTQLICVEQVLLAGLW
jgi:hypothetical protein